MKPYFKIAFVCGFALLFFVTASMVFSTFLTDRTQLYGVAAIIGLCMGIVGWFIRLTPENTEHE